MNPYGQNKNGSQGLPFVKIFGKVLSNSFFLNPCAFTTSAAEEIQFRPANFTSFIQHDGFDIGRIHREGSFHTNGIRNLTYGKGSCSTLTLTFDHIALKTLDTFLITFNDLVVNGNIVPCFEFGNFFSNGQLCVYKIYCGIHILEIWTAKVGGKFGCAKLNVINVMNVANVGNECENGSNVGMWQLNGINAKERAEAMADLGLL